MAWFRVDVPPSGGGGTSFDFLGAAAGQQASFALTDEVIGTTTATKIPQYMFYNNKTLYRIDLSTIEEVQLQAFHGCDYISYINLPNCITVGESAFENIIYFNDPTRPASIMNFPKLVTVGANAFRNVRPSSGSIVRPIEWHLDSVETIGVGGFRGQNYTWSADEILLPKLKTVSGAQAFQNQTIGTLLIGEDCTTLNNNFLQGATVTNFIVLAPTPPTLGSNSLGSPTLSHIYVPAASVSIYQSDSKWGAYSSIIEAYTPS